MRGGAHLNILDNSSAGLLPTSNTIIPAPFLDTLDKGGTALSRDRSWLNVPSLHHDTIQDWRVFQKHPCERALLYNKKQSAQGTVMPYEIPHYGNSDSTIEGKIYNPEL
jgi:hypothetical protein